MTIWSHEHKASLPATPESVFAALTSPVALRRWFADEVEIEPREGGSFRFWGKHVYGGAGPKEALQRVTRWTPNEALAFTWPIDGAETEVAITLTPLPDEDGAPPSTSLLLRHTSPVPLEKELISDIWKLTMGNLGAYLAGGDGIVLPDYTDPNPEIRLSIVIDAPRERVFRALVDPEALGRWVGAKNAVVEPRVGGAYRYGWRYEVEGNEVDGGPTTILDPRLRRERAPRHRLARLARRHVEAPDARRLVSRGRRGREDQGHPGPRRLPARGGLQRLSVRMGMVPGAAQGGGGAGGERQLALTPPLTPPRGTGRGTNAGHPIPRMPRACHP